MKKSFLLAACIFAAAGSNWCYAQKVDVAKLAEIVKGVDREGAGHRAATAALRELEKVNADQLITILKAMDGVTPLNANWFRASVETIAAKDTAKINVEALTKFAQDTKENQYARMIAFDLATQLKPELKDSLLAGFTEDPCLELRQMSIDLVIAGAEKAVADNKNDEAKKAYESALANSRDPEQIQKIAGALEKLGTTVNLTDHFGFITKWKLIGPFDNVGKKGFDTVFAPEEGVNFDKEFDGKSGKVQWVEHKTEDKFGKVDLNTAIGELKGATTYAAAFVIAKEPMEVDIRLGCTNANKVWVNGELAISNHVYHAGEQIDQYVGKATLKKGLNTILVKNCQNEQTDPWAKDWSFQLRITDATGKNLGLPATVIPPTE